MEPKLLTKYKQIAINLYKKYPNISDEALSYYLHKDSKAGFDPNQRRNPDGTWGNNGCTFKKWFGESKTVNGNGTPKIFYHGTTHGFEEFSNERGNPENDFGVGFYFSNSIEDVQANYKDIGPDLTGRIDRLIEQIENDNFDIDISDSEIRRRAEVQVVGNVNRVIPVYLSIQNPVIIGSPVYHAEEQETIFDYDYGYNSETDEYGEETGLLVEFIETTREVIESYGDYSSMNYNEVITDILDAAGGDGLSASDLGEVLRKSGGLFYGTDDSGRLIRGEVIRSIYEKMGFDGIIDNTVNEKFGRARQFGQAMSGVYEDTQHAIAFKPNQIKRTDAESFCSDSNNINKNQKAGFQESQIRDSQGRWTDAWAGMKKYEQEIKKNDFESAGVYDKDGNEIFTKKGASFTVFFSKEERDLMRDAVLTHNHPGMSSFSHADISFLFSTGLTDIRAINSAGDIFSMNKAADYGDIFAKFGRNPIQLINTAFQEATLKVNKQTNQKIMSLAMEFVKGKITDTEMDSIVSDLSGAESHVIWEEVANSEFGRFALKYTKE